MSDSANSAPRIFISYSWSSQEHQNLVIDLATRLMGNGVSVVLDVWDFKEGQDKYHFMEKMVLDKEISHVLVVVDKIYAEKADSKAGGVGSESQIMSADLYSKVEQTKFIPIVLEYDDDGPILPIFLKSRKYIDFSANSSVDHFQYLLRVLFNKPLIAKPSLGKAPQYLSTINYGSNTQFHEVGYNIKKSISSGNTIAVQSHAKNYFREIARELDSQRILEFKEEQHDEEVVARIHSSKGLQRSFLEITNALIEYDPDLTFQAYLKFFETLLNKYSPSLEMNRSYRSYQADNLRFIVQEFLLIYIALLLKTEAFTLVDGFMRNYFVANKKFEIRNMDFTEFYAHLDSLDGLRNSRLNLNRTSLTADLLKERTDSDLLHFNDLIAADLVFFLRAFISDRFWLPRTVVYLDHHDVPELFVRAESVSYFKRFQTALGVFNIEELKSRYNEAGSKRNLSNLKISQNSWPIDVTRMINFNKLSTLS